MKTIAQLRAILAAERNKIPTCNLPKFDAEADDFIVNVSLNPKHYNHHCTHMWNRIKVLQAVDASKAPPMLIRKDDETDDEHMERCYKAGGYGSCQ